MYILNPEVITTPQYKTKSKKLILFLKESGYTPFSYEKGYSLFIKTDELSNKLKEYKKGGAK